jgi:Subtilase family
MLRPDAYTVGAVGEFITAAERIPGLEWLVGSIGTQLKPNEDFYWPNDVDKPLSGKLFLLGSNRQALDQVVRLWERYRADKTTDLGRGLNAWKDLFLHLKEVRFWGPRDRLDDELRQAWRFRLETGAASLKFEIEAWLHSSPAKNAVASVEVRALVGELGGRVLDERQILDIAYHGFLVEMSAPGVLSLLDGEPPPLLRSERVMFLRPQGQAAVRAGDQALHLPDTAVPELRTSGPPIVAILDGLPLANHARLRGRLIIDDPNQWAEAYPAGERIHGTAIASLIAWGELDGAGTALAAPIYVRPILRPDPNINSREECTPDDRLLVDLVHEAVRRMFDNGAPGVPPAAPTVRVINISVGDKYRPFAGELSPWARLLDWLSYKYKVLFIVSSGNCADNLVLNVARESLHGLTREAQASTSMLALVQQDMHRRLLAPAESVNALTVGASYDDASTFAPVPGRFTLFAEGGIAPYSRIGPGFRRAIKPEVLLPGGRVTYRELPTSPLAETHLKGVWHNTPQPPGQRVAAPPDATGDTIYTRGTSNSA